MPMGRTVTLVDEKNNALGTADIIDAHTGQGKLHRAFSVYVFRKNQTEILIQRRSEQKMLWGGIWANTCCSHPYDRESAREAGGRRLMEELGFTTDLKEGPTFVYRALDPQNKGVEHEFVTILVGEANDVTVREDPKEVMEWKWVKVDALQKDMTKNPDTYAPWFHIGLEKILSA